MTKRQRLGLYIKSFNFKIILSIVCLAVIPSCRSFTPNRGYELQNLVQYANPMVGTEGNANTFPGATLPFGMIQISPDTELGRKPGGYASHDKRISDFSVDHISGTGCSYGGDFAIMPILENIPASPPNTRINYAASFSHANEIVRPGYYGVTFDNGMQAEMTTTLHTGFERFTYPGNLPATLMINTASDINGSTASAISINPDTHEISGWSTGGHFCDSHEERTIYFYALFDRQFTSWSTWSNKVLTNGNTSGTGAPLSGSFVTFDTSVTKTVMIKIGISYVSLENAKANVEVENPASAFSADDFKKTATAAANAWNVWLNKIQVSGGTRNNMETFYSMLYHTALGPIIVSDTNGQYMGYDDKVHTVANQRRQYGVFSGWDIYRSEVQLLAMIAPKEASDMAQSLVTDYQQDGTFPRWGVMTADSWEMSGDPAAAMIAGFYAFGATDFDTKTALRGLMLAATDPAMQSKRTKWKERDNLVDYLGLGYIPEYVQVRKGNTVKIRRINGNVATTLEYASSDFALSQFAAAVGDEKDSATVLQHAQYWQNLFNPSTGYLQARRVDGSWAPGFINKSQSYDHQKAYAEGSAAQYVWMVPFNEARLAELMGGYDTAIKRLDYFLTKLNSRADSEFANLGNEPCLETPWLYDFWGQPWKTQNVVHRALSKIYSNRDNGYLGNDDVGEMSSWYIFGVLGMYPELPGSDVLVLGSPLFQKAVLHLPHGDVTIVGNGISADKNMSYVQALLVNRHAWNKPWIRYSDIAHGGTLVYDLGTTPTSWGSDLSNVPPSYGR